MVASTLYSAEEEFALEMDHNDPLRVFRRRFSIPKDKAGNELVYLCGNSLGLQPVAARPVVEQELADWANLAVDGHFGGSRPWYPYHEQFRKPLAEIVGAEPDEVVVMNSLTVNLHLLMVSFYRPRGSRRKIVIEYPAFPSDVYAVKSQIQFHGGDPERDLIVVEPRAGAHSVATSQFDEVFAEHGEQVALVMVGGVNFFSGQVFEIEHIVKLAHKYGAVAGLDLAHAVGNVELALHKWGVDFAAWCNYKYLNGGPGAVGGAFVHRCHLSDSTLPRFAGWWGNDPDTRFKMHLIPEFVPVSRADAWQLSNPQILSMAPLVAAFSIFSDATMPALRKKAKQLTGYLDYLIQSSLGRGIRVITPSGEARGCQLSLLVELPDPKCVYAALQAEGVVSDFREPNIVRIAPVPLYNSYHDVWRVGRALSRLSLL